jgi:hypothetical protein
VTREVPKDVRKQEFGAKKLRSIVNSEVLIIKIRAKSRRAKKLSRCSRLSVSFRTLRSSLLQTHCRVLKHGRRRCHNVGASNGSKSTSCNMPKRALRQINTRRWARPVG